MTAKFYADPPGSRQIKDTARDSIALYFWPIQWILKRLHISKESPEPQALSSMTQFTPLESFIFIRAQQLLNQNHIQEVEVSIQKVEQVSTRAVGNLTVLAIAVAILGLLLSTHNPAVAQPTIALVLVVLAALVRAGITQAE